MNLLDPLGNVLATTTTSPNGEYEFLNLPPGEYQVEFVPPPGQIFTREGEGPETADSDPDPETGRTAVSLASGETEVRDAGLIADATISGVAWIDENFDGIRDPEENFLSGVTVHLLDDDGNVVDTLTTSPNGEYLFTNVYPGGYTVRFETPAGHTPTFQDRGDDDASDSDIDRATGEIPVTVEVGDQIRGLDGGYVPGDDGPASIIGVYWEDENRDCLRAHS